MKKQRIALIGMGWIGEHIRSCYEGALGELLSENMTAFKKSETGLEKLRHDYPFPILAGDYHQAFMDFSPTFIILSTPPKQVKPVTEGLLKPYVAKMRSEGQGLPILLSFAPTPNVKYFENVLGDDIPVFTVLPAMETQVGGTDCRALSNTMLTPNPSIPPSPDALEQAIRFLSHLAQVFIVPLPEILPILSAKITYHMMDLACQDIAKQWFPGQIDDGQQIVAGRMRYFFLEDIKAQWSVIEPLARTPFPEYDPFLKKLQHHWYQGTGSFLLSHGIISESAQRICDIAFELHLLCLQKESSSTILHKVASHATQGGMSERAVQTYHALVRPVLLNALQIQKTPSTDQSSVWNTLQDVIFSLAREIYEHGLRLAE